MRPHRLTAWAGAGLVWACAAFAGATPASDAAKLERQQAQEQKKARDLAARARAAQAKEKALAADLAGLANDRAATEAARVDSETQLEAVKEQARQEAENLARSRDALEKLVIGLIQNERAAGAGLLAPRADSGPVAGLFTQAVAAQTMDSRTKIAEAAQTSEEITQKRNLLIDQTAQLQRASAITQEQIAAAASERETYQTQAAAAAARSQELARLASDLRDLAARAAVTKNRPQVKIAAIAPGGRRLSPAQGAVKIHFGAPTKAGGLTQGLTLRTTAGEKVVAPAAATITYAGPFRSYGQVLILDQGNGYVMILTGLDSAFAGPGDKVEAGALIGQMPRAGKTSGAVNPPDLYFEVRQAGRPIDPERWLGLTG
jgi:septal ring factor EnvC (AmiA/AmiB activator)